MEKKARTIKPQYIKDAQGRKMQVYLDIKTYEAILERLKKFEEIKKRISS